MTTAPPERTALIVDDEDTLLRLMTRVLEKENVRVLAAQDAASARALFDAHEGEIDLLVLDVMLPDGDGAETLLPEFVARRPTVRVVVASGDEPPEAVTAELTRIGGHFLRKPFAPKDLIRLVREASPSALPRSSAPAATGPS
jgi:DNA-binding NtrC family response regulator